MAQATIANQHGVTFVAHDRGGRKNLPDHLGIFAFVPGLLTQLTYACLDRRTVDGVHSASWDFQLNRIGAVAELLDHDQLLVRSHCHHIDPVHAVDDEKIVRLICSRRDFCVCSNTENAEIAERCGVSLSPGSDHIQAAILSCFTTLSQAFVNRAWKSCWNPSRVDAQRRDKGAWIRAPALWRTNPAS